MNILTWILKGAGILSVFYFIFSESKDVKKIMVLGWTVIILVLVLASILGYNFTI